MNYEDAILVKLADPASRAGIFDEIGLEQILSAAYDIDSMSIEAPFSPVFDDFRIGVALPSLADVEGSWMPIGGVEKTEARFQLSGLAPNEIIHVDALWRGSVVARAAHITSHVVSVTTKQPDLSKIDERIVADLGTLPNDPALLEQERRKRVIETLQTAFNQPDLFAGDRFDNWLRTTGASSVSELLITLRGVVHTTALQVQMDEPPPPVTAPKPLAIAAAILIRDKGFSIGQLLVESKRVKERLAPLAFGRKEEPNTKQRASIIVIWVVPQTVFDDTDWPGANSAQRRSQAGSWLAKEGIGLMATA
jgi:hypothetical protein